MAGATLVAEGGWQSGGAGTLGHSGHGRFGSKLRSGTFQPVQGWEGGDLHVPTGPNLCKYFFPWGGISA